MTKFARGGITILALILIGLAAAYTFAATPKVYYHWRCVELQPGPLYGIWIEDADDDGDTQDGEVAIGPETTMTETCEKATN